MNSPSEARVVLVPSEGHDDDSYDDDGYGEVFRTYRLAVFRFAVMLCHDRHVAEEVTADVFARVLVKWRNDEVLDPLPYLRRAVLNEVRSRWRRLAHEHRAKRQRSHDFARVSVDQVEDRDPLMAALRRLPIRQRSVVVLRYLEDVSEAEVARLLSMAPGTVKSQASRGLAALRSILEEKP